MTGPEDRDVQASRGAAVVINDAQVGGRTRKKKATKTNVNPIPRFGETEDEYRPVECKKVEC